MFDTDDDEHGSDDRRTDLGTGLRVIADLLSALDDAGEASGAGSHTGKRTGFEYHYTARLGLGDRPEDRGSDDRPGIGSRPPSFPPRPGRGSLRPSRSESGSTGEYPTTVDRGEDELVVTVDLRGVDVDDLQVGTTGDALVVAVDGRTVLSEPIDLPTPRSVRTRSNNGILEVRLWTDGGGDE